MLPQRTLYTIPQVSIFPTLSSGYSFPTLSAAYPIPHTVISSAARNLFRPRFPASFAKPLEEAPPPTFSEKRCFPFLFLRHSPSCRQRKRSLDFARDDDTRNVLSHTFFVRCTGYHSPRCHRDIPFLTSSFRAQREIFFVHLFPSSFAKPSRRSTALPPFLRYGVSRFSFSNTLHLTANEKDPSTSLGMTIRETCFLTHSLYDARDLHSPHCHRDIHSPHCHRDIHSPRCHFERSEKSFSSPFSRLLR